MEIRKKVRVFKIINRCDFCMAGEMVPTGEVFLSNPPQYIHKCNCCENIEKCSNGKKYPYFEYKDID